MADFIGTAGVDTFIGSDPIGDVFYFTANEGYLYQRSNLGLLDVVSGGGDASSPKDTLVLYGIYPISNFINNPISVELNAVAYDANGQPLGTTSVTGIEQIILGESGIALVLTNHLVNSSSNGVLEIYGTGNANDYISWAAGGSAQSNRVLVYGGGGDDRIGAVNGTLSLTTADEFYGGSGSDWIGLHQNATGHGGDGNDILESSQEAVAVSAYGDAGSDVISLSGSGTAYGGDGDDNIGGKAGSSLFGGAGSDVIGITGNGTADGGSGIDYIFSYGTGATIVGGDGIDFANLNAYQNSASMTGIEGLAIGFVAYNLSDLQGFTAVSGSSYWTPIAIYAIGGGSLDLSSKWVFAPSVFISLGDTVAPPTNYNITGSITADYFTGSMFDDTLAGVGGNDYIYGQEGNDFLYGGIGDDTLLGGLGADTIYGGDGNDSLFIEYLFETPNPKEFLYGGAGDDVFKMGLTTTANSVVDGGAGFDTFECNGDLGSLQITGFELLYLPSAGFVRASASQLSQFQQIYLLPNFYGSFLTYHPTIALTGGGTVDLNGKMNVPGYGFVLVGYTNESLTYFGSSLADKLAGGKGNDIVYGGGGNDLIAYTASLVGVYDVPLIAGDDNDSFYGGAGDDTIYGSMLVETSDLAVIQSYQGYDKLYGGTGNDVLYGGGGIIDGGEGYDILNATGALLTSNITGVEQLNIVYRSYFSGFSITAAAFESFSLVEGNGGVSLNLVGDGFWNLGYSIKSSAVVKCSGQTNGVQIIGTAFIDSIEGSAASDWIDAGGGSDSVAAGDGNDVLVGRVGSTLNGGNGSDWIIYYDSPAVVANLALGNTVIGSGNYNYFIQIENLWGSAFNDSLTGDAGENWLVGAGGNDLLYGGGGSDYFLGGDGADRIDGGAGFDSVMYYDSSTSISVTLGGGGIGGTANGDTLIGVEAVYGSEYNDTIAGDADANVLAGGGGNDLLIGGLGADYLSGGNGFDTADYSASSAGVFVNLLNSTGSGGSAAGDTLVQIEAIIGSNLADVIYGDAAANLLTGGLGNDLLWGAGGADLFWYGTAAFGSDMVAYFEDGTDRIAISTALASSFAQLVITGNGTSSVNISFSGGTINVTAQTAVTLTSVDFVFI